MMWRGLVLQVLAASALLCAGSAHGKLTFQVEPRTSECFFVDVPAPNHQVSIDFWVLRGGLLDIDLRIMSPSGVAVFSGLQFESNSRDFIANEAGAYEVCWNNEMSRWTAKVVQFAATVSDSYGNIIKSPLGDFSAGANAPKPATKEALNPMEDAVRQLGNSLDAIQRDQKYLLIRETRHRDTAESTNGRIVWYSLFESLVLLSISLGQVFYLRKFFGGGAGRV